MLWWSKLLGVFFITFLLFVLSGYLANWVFAYTHCLWTSSGVFTISFVSLFFMFVNKITYLADLFHLF